MGKDLKLEAFASKEKVMPVSLHAYKLISQNITDIKYKVIRGASWKIRNYNQCGVFDNGEVLFSTEKVNTDIPNVDFELEYLGKKQLEVQENRRVYEALIKYYILKKLERVLVYEKYRKYSCKNDVTSKFIMTETGLPCIFTSQDKEIVLERKYSIRVTIKEDGHAYLYIDTSSVFSSRRNLYDYILQGKNVLGMEVKNDWGKNKQSGIVTEVCDFTVMDPLDFTPSLKEYYVRKGEAYRVEKLPNDTPVIKVKLNEKSILPYYPQALKPVLTREMVKKLDPDFSTAIEKYIKRDMKMRLKLDQDFIHDIGSISELQGLSFESECCPVSSLGYKKGRVELPRLSCAHGKTIECGQEIQVFQHGFYKKPDRKIKIGYLYPVGTEELMKAVANAIYTFSVQGKFQGKEDRYICTGLLDIQGGQPIVKEEYELGDLTDYKRAAHKIRKVEGIDIVIALVPDGMEDDGPYNPFKTMWAEANIPSQMISIKTAELFQKDASKKKENKNTETHVGTNVTRNTYTKPGTSRYYLHNIVLGILGKTGGTPWIVKDIPGEVDCFVGMDVATADTGIHFPACSVVFDKYGKLLGFYKPKQAQRGEKIETKILQDIFDQIIFSFEEEYGYTPRSIVIHRDGFSNENDKWYENYFSAKGISYNIVEVRKNIRTKLVMYEDEVIENPGIGYCVYNEKEAYLVTTSMKQKKGSPNPILVEKKYGTLSMPQILRQILYLTQLHVGSTQKTRLPITTGYADKICKNREFVPEGKIDKKLFFL